MTATLPPESAAPPAASPGAPTDDALDPRQEASEPLDSVTHESAPPAAPAAKPIAPAPPRVSDPRRGFFVRLFIAAALPLVAFAVLALQVVNLPPAATGTEDPTATSTLFVGLLLALAATGALAWWLDRGFARRLDALAEALKSRNLGGLRDLVGARGWGGTRRLAAAVREAVAHTHEDRDASEQLKALQESADDLKRRIEAWAQSEIAPTLDPP